MSEVKEVSDADSKNSEQSQSSNPKFSMLRPSLFGSNLKPLDSRNDNKPNELEQNPFLKSGKDEVPKEDSTEDSEKEAKEPTEKEDPLNALKKNGLAKSNLFTAAKNSIVENSGFVFGQNVHERVVGENLQSNAAKTSDASDSDTAKPNPSDSNLFFSNAMRSTKSDDDTLPAKENDNKSLTEIAREYEESRAQKRKYEEVETFTGEENEVNIIDLNCKLFAFINSNWEERGRGNLRLNDSKDGKNSSRVVFRTSGNLRLLVNTKVWDGMVCEQPSKKSLRLTAMDNTGRIKVFLVMSRPEDITALHDALFDRIEEQKKIAEDEKDDDDDGESENKNQSLDAPSPKKPTITVD